ncbi:MAG: SURF1 family protein [Gammaproteobacteria bacterium]|nr:SURF1 family protein [Gammaproteobacteria bacterium]
MTGFVVVMLPLVLALGVWQLQRAAEMRGYQERYFDRLGMLPQAPPRTLSDVDFLRLRLTGEYLPGEHYLVDNKLRNGEPGYWVVSRFRCAGGRVYLLNRGWLAAPASRGELPAVPTPEGPVTVVGVVWPDTGMTLLLAADPWPERWPKRVQRLNVSRMAQDAGAQPAEIRLESGQPGVLAAAPVDAAFRPERHQGYAVQWFGLAVVLLAGFVLFGFYRHGPRS